MSTLRTMAGFGSLCIDVSCAIVPRTWAWLPIYRPTHPRTRRRGCAMPPIHRWVSTHAPHCSRRVAKPPIKDALCIPPGKSYEQPQVRSVGMYCWQNRATTGEGPQGISAESNDRVSMQNGGRARVRRCEERAHACLVCYLILHIIIIWRRLTSSPPGGTTTTPYHT